MAEEVKEKIILPEKYYHTYFQDLLSFIQKHSFHLLGEDEKQFIDDFQSLSENGQCLYIRFSNRKGPYFRIDKLKYQEIEIPKAVSELMDAGFITQDFLIDLSFLNLFTKKELLNAFTEHTHLRHLPKADLIFYLFNEETCQDLLSEFDVVKVLKQEELEYVKLLYFGHYRGQMTEFVIRDIGNVKLEKLDENQLNPWFETQEEARALFEVSIISRLIRHTLKVIPAGEIIAPLTNIDFSPYTRFGASQKVIDRTFLELGLQLERENLSSVALIFYQHIKKPPARERRIRIYDQQGENEKAVELANEILSSYRNASELVFAKDFLNRPNIRINRSTTEKIKEAELITLKKDDSIPVEKLVLNHFIKQGYEGWHVENFFWRNLFGLFFWEELFDQSFNNFHNPIQRTSSDLYDPDFYVRRKDVLNKKIKKYANRKKFLRKVDITFREKYGINNQLVYWFDSFPDIMEKSVRLIPMKALLKVLLEMSRNLKDNTTGFPDLLICKEDEYHFYEVKSPNDHLSSQQLFWINFMQENGIKAQILRIEY